MSELDGGPAFPVEDMREGLIHAHHGMSLRDWFAGQALAGLATGFYDTKRINEAFADDAYALADAMLAERNK